MSALTDLIRQVEDENLRGKLLAEADKLAKQKKFGLVFEEHLPECTRLYDITVKVHSQVSLATGSASELYEVKRIEGPKAYCKKIGVNSEEESIFDVDQLVVTASFGEPIYPCLMPIDSVCNAPDSDLWHTIIEADNYHALQLLEYLYCGKVDCIYIDPPYNTGARDWKYNNDYVDANDNYRHSKWLSMMKKRLVLAKKLLNTSTGVLIVAIDDNELNTTGLLLQEIFSGYHQFCITVIHNPNGNQGKNFGIQNEFAYFVLPTNRQILCLENREDNPDIRPLRDVSGNSNMRTDARNCFYPILIKGENIISFGDVCDDSFHPISANIYGENGIIGVYPIDASGKERKWVFARQTVEEIKGELYVEWNKSRKIYDIIRRKTHFTYKTVWDKKAYNANSYGSKLLAAILGGKLFDYPKSLYTVEECIRAVCGQKSSALIVDFFAGSGTTLHAVNLLNAEDGGHRQCIMVTNNEVSADEESKFTKQGKTPNSPEWIAQGIARNVTWPRTVCTIEGHDVNGKPLSGDYLTTSTREVTKNRTFKQISFPLQATAERKQFASLIGLSQTLVDSSGFIVTEDKDVSVLFDTAVADDWLEALEGQTQVKTVYICTEDNRTFKKLKGAVNELVGDYTVTEPVKLPMAEGFKANAAFFKLGFLDKNAVSLGWALKELLSILWLKAGSHGPCPIMENVEGEMLILPENRFAVLMEETAFADFAEQLKEHPEISTAYLVTDYEPNYVAMAERLHVEATYQLYKDYLENFTINQRRN